MNATLTPAQRSSFTQKAHHALRLTSTTRVKAGLDVAELGLALELARQTIELAELSGTPRALEIRDAAVGQADTIIRVLTVLGRLTPDEATRKQAARSLAYLAHGMDETLAERVRAVRAEVQAEMDTKLPATKKADAHDAAKQASYERSDTDGYITQWAHGVMSHEARLQAQVDGDGGVAPFPALFDLDGNLVPAKLIDGQYGLVWGVFEDATCRGRVTEWVNRSNADKAATRNKNMAKKGYSEGTVMAPAKVVLGGGGTGLAGAMNVMALVMRADDGYSADAHVVTTLQHRDY